MDHVRLWRHAVLGKFLDKVGGNDSRGWVQRASWASFFDDVDAVLFLSPISCFDERLREDRDVNRLEDSIQLWRRICSSPILAKAQIILFLNKCDILHNKLKRGVVVKNYVPTFADRKNDTITVMKCMCTVPVARHMLMVS